MKQEAMRQQRWVGAAGVSREDGRRSTRAGLAHTDSQRSEKFSAAVDNYECQPITSGCFQNQDHG